MTSPYYLPAPAFGLTWFQPVEKEKEENRDPLSSPSTAYVLMPGGGGSAKTGVKNQIMIASMNSKAKRQDQVKLVDGFITDTEDKRDFGCGIAQGTILNRCVLYTACPKEESEGCPLKFEQQVELAAAPAPANETDETDLNCCLISDEGLVIAGGDYKVVYVWEIAVNERTANWQGKKLFELKGHQQAITSISEHPLSNWICTTAKDGCIKIWDLAQGLLLVDIPALVDLPNPNPKVPLEVRGASFSVDGASLYSIQCTRKGPTHLITWELTKKPSGGEAQSSKEDILAATVKKFVFANKFPCSKMALSEDGQYLAVGVADGHLQVYRSDSLARIANIACHDFPITGIAFAPLSMIQDENVQTIIATCSPDRNFNVIRLDKNEGWKKKWFWRLVIVLIILLIIYYLYQRMMAVLLEFDGMCPETIERLKRLQKLREGEMMS
eukprot:gene5965-6569_t